MVEYNLSFSNVYLHDNRYIGNSYSYAFKAIQLKEFDAVAILFVRQLDVYFSDSLWPKFFKMSLFYGKEKAISWLLGKLQLKYS